MRSRTLVTVIVASGLIAVGGTLIAQAAIPSADGTFTACINKTSGAVRIIDAEKTPRINCATNEIRRTWNVACSQFQRSKAQLVAFFKEIIGLAHDGGKITA